MNRAILLVLLISIALPLGAQAEEWLTFTDVFGQETKARIVKVEGGQVFLEQEGGKRLQLNLKSLPADEKAAIQAWLKSGGRALPPRRVQKTAPPKPMTRKPKSTPAASPATADPVSDESNWLPGERALYDKALSLKRAGRSDQAVPIAERWLKMREEHYGPDHPDTGAALNNVGVIYQDVGRFEDARRVFERSLEIDEAAFGKDHPETAVNLGNLADLFAETGDLEQAEKLNRKALEILVEAHGKDHPDTATSIGNLAALLSDMGRFKEAEREHRRVLAIREKALGPDHEEVAGSLNNLGVLMWKQDRFEEAESFYLRALKIDEVTLGPDHLRTARTVGNLATLYGDMGRFDEAEQHLLRALEVKEDVLGSSHPDTAITVNGLGGLYHDLGQFERAERFYRRALKMAEEFHGPDHPAMALALNNLGGVNSSRRRFEEAEGFYRRAYEINLAAYGPDHPTTAGSLNNLAAICANLGNLEEARDLIGRALKIRGNVFGADSPDTALTLQNLAVLNEKLGQSQLSIPLYERAIRINKEHYGPHHPQTALVQMNLALLHLVNGDLSEAKALAVEINRADESTLAEVLGFTNEQERLAYRNSKLPFALMGTLGMAEQTGEAVLRQKGIVLESLLEDRKIAAAADPELVERIRSQRSELRRLRLTGGGSEEERDEIREAETDLDALEKELARNVSSAGGVRESLSIRAADIAGALPEKTALVEFVQFLRLERHPDDSPEFRYAGVIFRKGQEPVLVDCGEAAKVLVCVREIRQSLGTVDLLSLRTGNKLLGEILIDPLRPHLDGIENLVISPDSQLNFLSFAALFDEKGRFLAEEFRIHYVAGGRDLLRELIQVERGAPLIVGNPAFRTGNPDSKGNEEAEFVKFAAGLVRDVKADDLESLDLLPLPGAKLEANRVKTALESASRKSRVLIGADATESAIREVSSPEILHLATHGFYLNQIGAGDGGEALPFGKGDDDSGPDDGWERSLRSQGTVQNPMYRSGIALAGAQSTFENWRSGQLTDPNNDGVLMAAEVADLDLRGTELVTLSACSTATGEVLSGEGVLGLRRGFVMAGARNLLMTLWPVADDDTADFMEDFYQRYAETGNAPMSLAEVQREWLVRLREERGLLHAVNRVGPFIMSSQGRLE